MTRYLLSCDRMSSGLQVGFSAADFIAAYEPFVVDCTHEEEDGGEGEDMY